MRKIIRLALQAVGVATIVAVIASVGAVFLIGPWLQYQTPQLAKADYIVALAGDEHRWLKAAELYKEGYAPTILLSNEIVRRPTRAEEIEAKIGHPRVHPYQMRREILNYLGVPADATAEFGHGHVSTVEEAEALRAFIGDRNATFILVTSPFHARRAKLTFERVMPGSRFMMASPPEGKLHDPWWGERDSALHTITEVAKLAYFWLGGAFRARAAQ